MTIEWQDLPKPDGAPFHCCVKVKVDRWPFVGDCEEEAEVMLPEEFWPKSILDDEFMLSGRIICGIHKDAIERFLDASGS